MNSEVLEDLVGKPINLRRKNGFILTGYIEKIVGDTIVFVTNQKQGYIDVEEIGTVTECPRQVWMEICNCCKKVFLRKTATQKCPYCSCK